MSTPTTVIWPCLNYRDALGAIRFLVDVVGFDEAAVYTGPAPALHSSATRTAWTGRRHRPVPTAAAPGRPPTERNTHTPVWRAPGCPVGHRIKRGTWNERGTREREGP